MVALWNRADYYIFILWFLSILYLLLFLALSQRPHIGCLPYFHTWCGLSANLECRSEMCCTLLAEKTAGPKKVARNRHLGTIAHPCRAISSKPRHVSTIGKSLLNSNMSSRCPHNMLNIGPLTAEIFWRVLGTLANFNGFGVLAALLHGSQVVTDVSQTLQR